jgi:hypothetical protein
MSGWDLATSTATGLRRSVTPAREPKVTMGPRYESRLYARQVLRPATDAATMQG